MRVTHVVPALFDETDGVIGGAERYAFELARHMADRVPTRLLSFGARSREERIGSLDVRVVGDPWFVRGSRFNPLSRALLPEVLKATVVHCHQQHVLASTVSAILARATGRRVFTSDLGGGAWDLSAYVSTDRLYHGHLHISEFSRDVFGHAGKPWAHVILGGVDTEKFSPAPGIESDGTVRYVGRLLPHKGIDYLVQAVPPDLPLEIIGRVHDPEYLRALESLAAGKQVRFRTGCSDPELVDAYRRALCVVLPSVYRTAGGETTGVPELLGQTLLEGMACGAPGVCTDVASLPEVVVDGETGFVVPPNDAAALGERLRWLASHPTEARAMGRASRERVLSRFTWAATVERCLDIYAA